MLQSGIKLPRKYQSSGVRDATSNQWRQTRRKLYESSDNPPKSPSGITFHRKMFPRISGGRRVETFDREFRVRLSWIMAFSCSSICSSNARMESRLISRSIAVVKPRQGLWSASGFRLLTSTAMLVHEGLGYCRGWRGRK